MKNFDPFVLPFVGGVIVLTLILLYKFTRWIILMPSEDKKTLSKGLFKPRIFSAIPEIFMEGLLHRRIWKVNPLLGYMHMSLAFGWFLLIVVGAIESKVQRHGGESEMIWEAIFYKFFRQDILELPLSNFFNFLMDFLLLFVLSGVILAVIKRFRAKWFGMKKKTRHTWHDQLALIALWCIFPLRLLAEGLTAGIYHNGGFLTGTLGFLLEGSGEKPLYYLSYTAWWAYSIALGTFFVMLPFSRYMHIPAEVVLIALRKAGLRTDKTFTGFSWIEVNACSKCGICIDECQLSSQAGLRKAPPIYLHTSIRNRWVNTDNAFNCLLCGKCSEFCPVKIDTQSIRITQRKRFVEKSKSQYQDIRPPEPKPAGIAYFAGCMSHLTPTITQSMIKIFRAASEDYTFVDEKGSICCGRPMYLAGKEESAAGLREINKSMIQKTGASLLVTSCPICYREFSEKYALGIEVLHHTQYINRLVREGRLKLKETDISAVYHDPCDLGRGSKVYEEPRELLASMVKVVEPEQGREKALCCGGSLGNIMLTQKNRDDIRMSSLKELMINNPDILVTACPLCKKTFSKGNDQPVIDIAELAAIAIVSEDKIIQEAVSKKKERLAFSLSYTKTKN